MEKYNLLMSNKKIKYLKTKYPLSPTFHTTDFYGHRLSLLNIFSLHYTSNEESIL